MKDTCRLCGKEIERKSSKQKRLCWNCQYQQMDEHAKVKRREQKHNQFKTIMSDTIKKAEHLQRKRENYYKRHPNAIKLEDKKLLQQLRKQLRERDRELARAKRRTLRIISALTPEEEKERRNRYERERSKRRMADPKFRLNGRMRNAIKKAIKEHKAGRRWEDLVGYTLQELVKHLERKFKPGMSWENFGQWHIDHIIPKSLFNYKTPEDFDFKRCWALSNLQPLWEKDNIIKNDNYDKPFQPSIAICM